MRHLQRLARYGFGERKILFYDVGATSEYQARVEQAGHVFAGLCHSVNDRRS